MLGVWKSELPELDVATEGIVERIQKINKYLDRIMNGTLADHGLDRGEWHLLTALRGQGKPYRVAPRVLAGHMGISNAALTNRLNQLEGRGLIRRLPDEADRRSVQVELTQAGWHAWQDSVGAQARKEALVASALTDAEKATLNRLLVRLMLEFEPRAYT